MTGDALRRVDVRGPLELTVQLRPTDVPSPGGPGQPFVARLPDTGDGSIQEFEIVVDGWHFEVAVADARQAELREKAARVALEHVPAAAASLRAQIPGRVTRVWVEAGDDVEAGQRLLAVEAMKMENELRAPRHGRVEAVHVEPGQTVERNDPLVSLA